MKRNQDGFFEVEESEQPDQGDLRRLYDDNEFGEAFIGFADHATDMSGLDRMIVEDCKLAGGKVVAPHLNMSTGPYWFRPEAIQRQVGKDAEKRFLITLQEAANLRDLWVSLEPTKEMIAEFCTWVAARGYAAAEKYFGNIAMAISEVEELDPEDVTFVDEIEEPAPNELGYHLVGEYPEEDDEIKPWVETQRPWYRKLIANVKAINDLDRLAKFGKAVYSRKMNKDQAGVFWTEYNIQKAKLEAKIRLSPRARKIIDRIQNSPKSTGVIGKWLYRVQKGEISLPDAPAEREWTLIWKAYQERKSAPAKAKK